jgi:hypothetical protein
MPLSRSLFILFYFIFFSFFNLGQLWPVRKALASNQLNLLLSGNSEAWQLSFGIRWRYLIMYLRNFLKIPCVALARETLKINFLIMSSWTF